MASLHKYFLSGQTARLFLRGQYSDADRRDSRQDFVVQNGIAMSYEEYDVFSADYGAHIRVCVKRLQDLFEKIQSLKQSVEHPVLIRLGTSDRSIYIYEHEHHFLSPTDIHRLQRIWPHWESIFQEILPLAWESWRRQETYTSIHGDEGWVLEARYPYSDEITGWLNWKELSRARKFLNKQESIGNTHGKMYSFHRFVENVLAGWLARTSLPIEQMPREAYLFKYNGRSKKAKTQQFKDHNIRIAPGEYMLVSACKAEELSSSGNIKWFDASPQASVEEKTSVFEDMDTRRQVEERLKYKYAGYFMNEEVVSDAKPFTLEKSLPETEECREKVWPALVPILKEKEELTYNEVCNQIRGILGDVPDIEESRLIRSLKGYYNHQIKDRRQGTARQDDEARIIFMSRKKSLR